MEKETNQKFSSNEAKTANGLTEDAPKSRRSASLHLTSPRNTLSNIYHVEREDEERHHSQVGLHAASLWRNGKVTDITVKFGKKSYPAHRPVLSCFSTYLRNILLAPNAPKDTLILDLPTVTQAAFESLLYFMYTGHLNLTCQNIGDVYTAARKLGVKKALEECTDVFSGKANALLQPVYLYATAKKLGETQAAQRSLHTMARHFEQIVGTKEFLDLTHDQLCEYLSCDELAIRSEVVVYLAALKWLNERFLEREQQAVGAISCTRFSLMSLNEVLACHSPPLLPGVTEIPEIKEMLLKGTCYVAAKTVNEAKRFESFSDRPRIYLIKRVPIVLWDPNIYDPDRYAQYKRETSATLIQACFRGYLTRKWLKQETFLQREAATKIQSSFREYAERKHLDRVSYPPSKEQPSRMGILAQEEHVNGKVAKDSLKARGTRADDAVERKEKKYTPRTSIDSHKSFGHRPSWLSTRYTKPYNTGLPMNHSRKTSQTTNTRKPYDQKEWDCVELNELGSVEDINEPENLEHMSRVGNPKPQQRSLRSTVTSQRPSTVQEHEAITIPRSTTDKYNTEKNSRYELSGAMRDEYACLRHTEKNSDRSSYSRPNFPESSTHRVEHIDLKPGKNNHLQNNQTFSVNDLTPRRKSTVHGVETYRLPVFASQQPIDKFHGISQEQNTAPNSKKDLHQHVEQFDVRQAAFELEKNSPELTETKDKTLQPRNVALVSKNNHRSGSVEERITRRTEYTNRETDKSFDEQSTVPEQELTPRRQSTSYDVEGYHQSEFSSSEPSEKIYAHNFEKSTTSSSKYFLQEPERRSSAKQVALKHQERSYSKSEAPTESTSFQSTSFDGEQGRSSRSRSMFQGQNITHRPEPIAPEPNRNIRTQSLAPTSSKELRTKSMALESAEATRSNSMAPVPDEKFRSKSLVPELERISSNSNEVKEAVIFETSIPGTDKVIHSKSSFLKEESALELPSDAERRNARASSGGLAESEDVSLATAVVNEVFDCIREQKNMNRYTTEKYHRPSLYTYEDEREDSNILIFGGIHKNETAGAHDERTMYSYIPALNVFKEFGFMKESRHHFCAVLLDNCIYCLGGCSSKETKKLNKMVAQSTCYKYDINSKLWSRVADMNFCRVYHSASVVRGRIFVVGGKDELGRILDSIESYIREEDVWRVLDVKLGSPKFGTGACSYSNELWIVGGIARDEFTGKLCALAEVEVFGPLEDKIWRHATKLPTARGFTTLIECHQTLFVIGGVSLEIDEEDAEADNEKFSSLIDVLQYDKRIGKWTTAAPLPTPCHCASAVTFGKTMFIMNSLTSMPNSPGLADFIAIRRVLLYNEELRCWKHCARLCGNLFGSVAVTLKETATEKVKSRKSDHQLRKQNVNYEDFDNFSEQLNNRA